MTGKKIAVICVVCSLMATVSITAWGVESGALSLNEGLFNGSLKRLIVGHVGRLLVLKSQLDVTEEQKMKAGAIVKRHLNEIVPAVKSVLEKRQALRQAVMKEKPNEKEIRAAAESLGKTMADASVLASKIVFEARPVFTDQQEKLVKDFKVNMNNATMDWLNQLNK